jgi:dipeptidyl aminopeptidase/acylaminoacyl peptidase
VGSYVTSEDGIIPGDANGVIGKCGDSRTGGPDGRRTGGAMKLRSLIFLTVLVLANAAFAEQLEERRDGTIVSVEACAPDPVITYEEYLEGEKKRDAQEVEAARGEGHVFEPAPAAYLTREQFLQRRKDAAGIECGRLRYLSDGLEVVAFLWKPKAAGKAKLPLIIFNRGGNREFSKVLPTHSFRRLTLEGFVVLASQYRGNDGGEGQEEFGGADVRDVINLLPVAESLGYVDMNNVFLLGWSRGGMMTALALKHGMKVNAAAIGGALTDLLAERERRPALAARVWSQLIPGYAERSDDVLRERSAVFWPEQIKTPLLLLHGGADWRADPADTLAFAQGLQRAGAKYQLILYAGDDHGIRRNREDSDQRIVEWFRAHTR